MAVRVKKCPKCGNIIERAQFRGNRPVEEMYRYGSPLRECAKCHHQFIDKTYHEMAIDGVRDEDKRKINNQGLVIMFVGVILSIMCFTSGGGLVMIIAGIGILLFATLPVIPDYLNYGKKLHEQDQEMKASQKRLENPQYVQILIKAGYKVPAKYKEVSDTQMQTE